MTLETDPSKLPPWARDISNALASAKEAPPEQRLVMFLAPLSAETLRLAGAESEEAGEVVAYATICLRGLFSDPGVTSSDEELALALSAMTASHHRWPMKPPLEPTAIVHPAPVQTRHVDLRELRKAIDRYCRERRRGYVRSSNPLFGSHLFLKSRAQKAR